MQLTITDEVVEQFPEISVLAITATRVRKEPEGWEGKSVLTKSIERFLQSFSELQELLDNSLIVAWREVYSAMGVKPNKHRSSVEALARRALKGNVRSINPLVDLYNASSLDAIAPLGAADLARLPGNGIVLRFAEDDDEFLPLGGDPSDFPISPKILVYACHREILCWGLNCRDSAMVSLNEGSGRILFLSEATNAPQREASQCALRLLRERLQVCFAVSPLIEVNASRRHADICVTDMAWDEVV